jgi:hypothetical protein
MPAPVMHTLIQLIALAWDNKARMTAPLSFRALSGLTRKSVRTLYGHLSVLQNKYAALRLQTAGGGIFVVVLADWLFEPLKPDEQDCKILQTLVKEEEEDSLDESHIEISPPPDDSVQEEEFEGKPHQIAKFDKRKPARKSMRTLSPLLREKLLGAGVFPTLLDEVAVSPYSEDDLRALLAWAQADKPAGPARLFIYRLRARANPPEAFRHPPCPYCGLSGGEHTPDCRGRYLAGAYADFLEH